MKRWMLGLLAVLFSTTLAAAQQQPPTPVTPQPGEIPQIVAFDNDGLLRVAGNFVFMPCSG